MVLHLIRDPQKVKMCGDIIIKHEKRVFIERVTQPETTVGTCHYLPHHAMSASELPQGDLQHALQIYA